MTLITVLSQLPVVSAIDLSLLPYYGRHLPSLIANGTVNLLSWALGYAEVSTEPTPSPEPMNIYAPIVVVASVTAFALWSLPRTLLWKSNRKSAQEIKIKDQEIVKTKESEVVNTVEVIKTKNIVSSSEPLKTLVARNSEDILRKLLINKR